MHPVLEPEPESEQVVKNSQDGAEMSAEKPHLVVEEEPMTPSPSNPRSEPGLVSPSLTDDYSSSGWFTLPTWWSKDKRKTHTHTFADIDACADTKCTEERHTWPSEHELDYPTTEDPVLLSTPKPVRNPAEPADETPDNLEVLTSSSFSSSYSSSPLPRQSQALPGPAPSIPMLLLHQIANLLPANLPRSFRASPSRPEPTSHSSTPDVQPQDDDDEDDSDVLLALQEARVTKSARMRKHQAG